VLVKLLIYSHFFSPSIGGVETIVRSVAQGLHELRGPDNHPEFEVTVVTQTPAAEFDDSSLSFPVVRRPTLAKLWSLVRESEVIHIAGPALGPLFLGFWARKPVVVEHHGFQITCPNGQLLIEPAATPCPGHFMAGHHGTCLRCNAGQGWVTSCRLWLLTFVRRMLCRSVRANITPTVWLGSLLQVPGIVNIPHGLDPTACPEKNIEKSEPPLIAFQGRLVTTKGVRLLLEAGRILAEQGRSFEVLVIGDGPERESLEQFSRELHILSRVRFAGRLSADQLDATLARASIVVVPSLGGEVFGLVVAENMLRGLPILASDLGAFVEVLGDTGLTFPTGDAAELARQLGKLLDDPALRVRLGQQARERALNMYNLGSMIDFHAALYRKLVNDNGRYT
jgi:glycosyltransferase involved in cell wall biosynthesis